MWTYKARVLRWVDGDTVDLHVDLGFNTYTVTRFRVLGIDTPETRGPERDRGRAAKLHAEKICPVESEIVIRTQKSDAFGRWLASITMSNGQDFGKTMIDDGQAVEY